MSIRGAVLTLLLLLAPALHAQRYPFLLVPGSPKGITSLFQDSKSRLWLGGDSPAFFDGQRFYPLRDYGLPSVIAVYDFGEDPSGAIWIAADIGLYRFAEGKASQIGKAFVTSVAAVAPDLVFAAVGPFSQGFPRDVSLARIHRASGIWHVETMAALNSPGPITLDRSGSILYARREGGYYDSSVDALRAWSAGQHIPAESHPLASASSYANQTRIVRDGAGCVWTSPGLDYICDGKTWNNAGFNGDNMLASISTASNGNVLLTAGNVLVVGRPGAFHVALAADGLPSLLSAIQSRDGTVWLGSTNGLYRFASPFSLEVWSQREGAEAPWSFARIGGEVYAGLDKKVGALAKDRTAWRPVASFDGEVAGLRASPDGNLFAALNKGGAALLTPEGRILAKTAAAEIYGLRLAILPNGETWLGGMFMELLTRAGSLLRFEKRILQTSPMGNVLALQYDDRTQKLWGCYNGGLFVRNRGNQWQEWTIKDGLLTNACWSMAALPDGDVIYAYYSTPAFAMLHADKPGHFTVHNFRQSDDVPDPESLNLAVDNRGWIWRGGNHGMYLATPDQARAGHWLTLNQSDGFAGEGVNSGSFFNDADGSVWFGVDNSIAHFTPPADFLEPKFAPQIFLSSYSWEGAQPRAAEATTGIPHGPKAIAHIGSLQFDRRNAIRIRYRILPDQTWRESKSLDIPLGTLGSGAHTLEVQSRLFTGPWSQTLARNFTVLTPLWRTTPLLLSYTAALALMLTGLYALHRRRIAQEDEMLPDLGPARVRAFLPEVEEVSGVVLNERFEVGELILPGGFANVMDGYDRLEKRRCALKIFRIEMADKDWLRRRFEDEASALRSIDHPNVVRIYASGTAPHGAPWLAMEFIEGGDLREAIAEGPLSPKRAGLILRQLADALDRIHALGIYHRDVKPDNIMLRNNGDAVLIDFSIAIVRSANEVLQGLSRAAGAFAYMAPEQAIGHAEPSTDVYGLARVTIEMLAGSSLQSLLPNAAMDLPGRLREYLAGNRWGLSEESIEMLASAQEFDPGRRPPAAGLFAEPIVRDLLASSADEAGA